MIFVYYVYYIFHTQLTDEYNNHSEGQSFDNHQSKIPLSFRCVPKN